MTLRLTLYLLLLLPTACATWHDGYIEPKWDGHISLPTKHGEKTVPAVTPQNVTKKTIKLNEKVKQQTGTHIARVTTLPSLVSQKGVGTVTNSTALNLPKGLLQLNADGLPLNRFIHMALGDVLQQAFQVDAAVAKRTDPVTLHISKPIEANRMLGLIQQALTAFDVALVETPEGLSVIPINKLGTMPPSLLSDKSRALIRLGRTMEIIPLVYATPGEALAFSRHFLKIGTLADASVNIRLNALIIIGDPQRVQQFREAVELIDQPSAQGKYIRLIRPIYWKNADLVDALQAALSTQGLRVTTTGTQSGVRLITLKQLNGIIIATSQKQWLDTSLKLIESLDIPTAYGTEARPYIYFVKNTRAKELGKIVNHVFSRTSAHADDQQKTIINRNSKSVASLAVNKGDNKDDNKEKSQIDNNQTIITDIRRNALIFVGTGEEYSQLLPILETLDISPRQVLIEATVAEVTLDESLNLGVEWQVDGLNIGALAGSLGTVGGLGAAAGGLTYQLIDQAGGVRALVTALATEGKAKILSSPKVLVMDNETARIQVGDQLLVVAGEVANSSGASGEATGVVRTFNYVDTGIILEVTPVINDGGVIQLKIHQEVSDAGPSINNTPPIFKRVVDTTLIANSGQSILIGGLMAHKITESESKVPFLGDIPYLGALFRVRSNVEKDTELVIMITPYLFDDHDDSSRMMDEFKHIEW